MPPKHRHSSSSSSLHLPLSNQLSSLPNHVMEYITSFLDPSNMTRFAMTCHYFQQMTEIVAARIQILVKQRYYLARLFRTYMKNYRESERLALHQLLQSKILLVRGFVAYTYHPLLNTWTRNPDLRRDRSYFSMIWMMGEIYCIGTYSVIASGTAERYNPITQVWTSIDALPQKIRSFSSCVWRHDSIFVIGGEDVYSNDLSPFIFTYKSSNDNSRAHGWKIHPARLLRPRYRHASIAYADHIWILGGSYQDQQHATNDVLLWNPVTNTWKAGASLCKGRFHFNVFVMDNKLYAVGGDNDDSNLESTIEVLDGHHGAWTIITSFPMPRVGYNACAYRGYIYIFGGNIMGRNTWDRYHIASNTWDTKSIRHDMPALPPNGRAVVFPPEHLHW
jgi:hypothetical protein